MIPVEQIAAHDYEVTVTVTFRIQAPHPMLAERGAMGLVSINAAGMPSLQSIVPAHKEMLFGSGKGPRNPNRTDVGENGHKKQAEPEPEPVTTLRLAIEEP